MEEKNKTFIIELFMLPTFDFIMEILRFGSWCEVLEPNEYRNQIKEVVNQMNRKYNK